MNAPIHFKLNSVARGAAGFFITALLAMSAATAQIASGTTGIDATGNAKSEMAACNNGRSQEDRATCMTETRNAAAAKRAGKLNNADGQFKANALKRCDVLSGEDKVACQARIEGYGEAKGSVAGGGVIREVETAVIPKDAGSNVIVQPKTSTDAIIVIPAQR
ncbi:MULTISPECIES: hypothetical protein [Polaromonas]|uniref:Uncharacterized protein n=1 Tax=Polaromonas aquatica TaxID=332657 RepID=A0ABW1U394_9BURK